MITLKEFLYLDNVIESQSKTLIARYSDLHFETPNDFREFFNKHSVVLRKPVTTGKTEQTMLLERFRSFKNSSDYANAKKYIEDQANIKKRLKDIQKSGGTIENITSILNNIAGEPLDPFFNFVVRKILTGSDTGVLPSEELRSILDKLIQQNTKELYDETSDVERDKDDRIKSYQNIYKNKGRIRVPVLDTRFIQSDFKYVIKTDFKNLPDAISAEKNVYKKAAAAGAILGGNAVAGGVSGGTSGLGAVLDSTQKFLSNLSNLINQSGNSPAALNAKIDQLQRQLDIKQQSIDERIANEIIHEQFIDSIAIDNLKKDQEIKALKDTNKILQDQIDGSMSAIQENVSKTLKEIPNEFDKIGSKLDEQNKIAQEQTKISQQQSEALQKTLQDLADSSKPRSKSNPKLNDSNPAAKIIKDCFSLLDKIYAIVPSSGRVLNITLNPNYDKMKQVFDKLSFDEPAPSEYVYRVIDRDDRSTPGGKKVKQILYWNNNLKQDIKYEIAKLTDEAKATEIKTILNDVADINSSTSLTLYNVIDGIIWQWFKNQGSVQGTGRQTIKNVYSSLNPKDTPPDDDGKLYEDILYKSNYTTGLLPFNADESTAKLSLDLIQSLDEISTTRPMDKTGWL